MVHLSGMMSGIIYTSQRAPSAAELNPQQHAAATASPGPLLVIAGAKDRS